MISHVISSNRFNYRRIWWRSLKALSHSRGATLFMSLLTGFKTLLLLRSGHNDICVAT